MSQNLKERAEQAEKKARKNFESFAHASRTTVKLPQDPVEINVSGESLGEVIGDPGKEFQNIFQELFLTPNVNATKRTLELIAAGKISARTLIALITLSMKPLETHILSKMLAEMTKGGPNGAQV